MTRPIYETADHLQTELIIAGIVSKKWKCEAKKLPMSNYLDFALCRRNRIHALIEIRSRTVAESKYKTIFCGLQKALAARELAKACKVPAFFVVKYTNNIKYINFDADFIVTYGGRNQMRDWQDKGLLAEFSVADMVDL